MRNSAGHQNKSPRSTRINDGKDNDQEATHHAHIIDRHEALNLSYLKGPDPLPVQTKCERRSHARKSDSLRMIIDQNTPSYGLVRRLRGCRTRRSQSRCESPSPVKAISDLIWCPGRNPEPEVGVDPSPSAQVISIRLSRRQVRLAHTRNQ